MSTNAWLVRREKTRSVVVGLQHPSTEPVLTGPFCAWLNAVPQPMYWEVGPLIPGWPRWHGAGNCPLIAVRGACCSGCAEGKGKCSGEEEVRVAKGYDEGSPVPVVGAIYVSDAELDALGMQVALMGADVDVAVASQEASLPVFEGNLAHAVWQLCKDQKATWDYKTQKCDFTKPDPTGASIGDSPGSPPHPLSKFRLERWTPFQMKWNSYRAETLHAPTDFDVLRTQFATLRDEWVGPLAQTTRSTVPAPLAETSKWDIPWGWIIGGAALIALPFALPAIAGTYLLLTKGKGLGLAALPAAA